MPAGHRYGVDHGVSFHVDDKLRTVLWGWAGRPLDEDDTASVRGLADQLATGDGAVGAALAELLAGHELAAMAARCEALLARGRMPSPARHRPAIPWPAF
jgi:uncharacterized repeat protein (TIGR03843 family)